MEIGEDLTCSGSKVEMHVKVKDNKHKNENDEDYRSGSKLKLPSIVRHQSYGYRDRFLRLMEEMTVAVTNGDHRVK